MKKSIRVLFFVLLMVLGINNVLASGSASFKFSDGESVNAGEDFTVSLFIDEIGGSDVNAANGSISIVNNSCVTVSSIKGANGTTATSSKFIGSYLAGLSEKTEVVKFNLKALSEECSITINISGGKIAFMDGTSLKDLTLSKTINVVKSSSSPEDPGNNPSDPGNDPSDPGNNPSDPGNNPGGNKSKDAAVNNIVPSKGNLSPSFTPGTHNYIIDLTEATDSINFTITPNDNKATKNGETCSLTGDSTTCQVVVTAEDGQTKSIYTIIVNKPASSGPDMPEDNRSKDNKLKSLIISGHTLNPSFDPLIDSYNLTVDNDVTSLNISAVTNDTNATSIVEGNTNLKVGANTVKVTVTAENGEKKIYSIAVTRKSSTSGGNTPAETKSSENRLKSLIVAEGTLSPSFNSNVNSYSIVVANNVNKLNITALPIDDKANVKIEDNDNFVVGEVRTVIVTVTAEDGTQKIYAINVKKSDKTSDAGISDISVKDSGLDQKFDKDKYSYSVTVPSNEKYVDITAKSTNPGDTVEYSINGGSFQSSGILQLADGKNYAIIRVTDKNGFTKQYFVDINRDADNTVELFGMKMPKWLVGVLVALPLILIGLFIIYLLFKKNNKQPAVPNIEFKPEFNFNSKNEDNDTVESGGMLNQNSSAINAKETKQIPYDPYDEIVTKEEIIDALESDNTQVLSILYEQEMLNRKKAKIREANEEEPKKELKKPRKKILEGKAKVKKGKGNE